MRPSSIFHNRYLHFSLYTIIGFLFFYKYGSRISDWLVLLFIPYTAILYYYIFSLKGKLGSKAISYGLLIASNIVLIAASYIVFSFVDVQDLQVDRWSVITHYWDAFFRGENPYSSTSHMGNYYGSYPFYFILGLPFYLINEIGWAAIAGIVLFQAFIQWKFRDISLTLHVLVLSIASLSIPYEIITRSTIFANSAIVLAGLYLFMTTWKGRQIWPLLLSSFVVGLLVCTRPIYGLVFLISGIYLLRFYFDWSKLILAGLFSGLGLLLPFIHLYGLFPQSIMEYNPVSFMTTHFVPTWFYVIYLLIAFGLAWGCKKVEDVIPACGIFLFLVVVLYAILNIVTKGWTDAIFNHFIDISYFFMALPFIIYMLVPKKTTSAQRSDNR